MKNDYYYYFSSVLYVLNQLVAWLFRVVFPHLTVLGSSSKTLQHVCVLVRAPTREESTSLTESSVGHEAFTGKYTAVLLYFSMVSNPAAVDV